MRRPRITHSWSALHAALVLAATVTAAGRRGLRRARAARWGVPRGCGRIAWRRGRRSPTPPAVAPRRLDRSYVLWALLGPLGAHRVYLHRSTSGLAMCTLTLAGFLFTGAWLVVLAWMAVDALLLPRWVRSGSLDALLVRAVADAVTNRDPRRWWPRLAG